MMHQNATVTQPSPEDDIFDVSKVLIWKVGAPGFEPGTFGSQNRRATKLRYAPSRSYEDCWRGCPLFCPLYIFWVFFGRVYNSHLPLSKGHDRLTFCFTL